jgi:hypothetical protein
VTLLATTARAVVIHLEQREEQSYRLRCAELAEQIDGVEGHPHLAGLRIAVEDLLVRRQRDERLHRRRTKSLHLLQQNLLWAFAGVKKVVNNSVGVDRVGNQVRSASAPRILADPNPTGLYNNKGPDDALAMMGDDVRDHLAERTSAFPREANEDDRAVPRPIRVG